MEDKTVTYLKISEGKVYATGMEKPESCWPQECKEPEPKKHFLGSRYVCTCRFEEEKFNQSFVEVTNWEDNIVNIIFSTSKESVKDGLYHVEGMVMWVKEQVTVKGQNNWYDIPENNCYDGTYEYEFRQVCTISLEPVEKKKKCTSQTCGDHTDHNVGEGRCEMKEIESPPDSKPDFSSQIFEQYAYSCYAGQIVKDDHDYLDKEAFERIWKEHVEPAHRKNAELEEHILEVVKERDSVLESNGKELSALREENEILKNQK